MSSIMKAMRQAAVDSAKPKEQRKRYSHWEGDAGYQNYLEAKARGMSFVVRLDGDVITGVTTADEYLGVVEYIPQPTQITDDGLDVVRANRRGVVAVDLVSADNTNRAP